MNWELFRNEPWVLDVVSRGWLVLGARIGEANYLNPDFEGDDHASKLVGTFPTNDGGKLSSLTAFADPEDPDRSVLCFSKAFYNPSVLGGDGDRLEGLLEVLAPGGHITSTLAVAPLSKEERRAGPSVDPEE